jgi:hypothetical protein
MKMEFAGSSKNYNSITPTVIVNFTFTTVGATIITHFEYQSTGKATSPDCKNHFHLFSHITVINKTIKGTQVLYRIA